MKFSRRGFIQIVGGAAAGAAASTMGLRRTGASAAAIAKWADKKEVWIASICQLCPGGCGILGRTMDGDLVKIEGNPLHPINNGTLCPKGFAGTQLLYDSDRIKGPLKRGGKRGEGKWAKISWDEAIKTVAEHLNRLRAQGEPHSLVILGGQYRGSIDPLFSRFARVYGTPNYIRARCLAIGGASSTFQFTQGLNEPLGFDIFNAEYILSFGCNLLESWISPVHQLQAYGYIRQERHGRRGKIVCVDPRLSIFAAKADQWVPINPGTDGALALGMVHVIIRESLLNNDFLSERSFGFNDWVDNDGVEHIGFKTLVLKNYDPVKVSQITGVPVENIIKLARDFATNKPAIAIGERGPSFGTNDLYTRMAIHALNAIVGSIGAMGGMHLASTVPLAKWPDLQVDEAAKKGLQMPRIDGAGTGKYLLAADAAQALPENIMAAKPYPAKAVFFYHTNPLYSHPQKEEFAKALEKTELLVSFSPFMDETSQAADLILPDHTYLEKWNDDLVRHLAGFSLYSLGRPVVNPLGDTRHTAEVLMDIARALVDPVARAFPWKDYQEIVKYNAKGLFESNRGYIVSLPEEESLLELMKKQGYWVPSAANYDEFLAKLMENGAWWDPKTFYGEYGALFKTPSRRYEFFSQTLRHTFAHAAKTRGESAKIPEPQALETIAKEMNLAARGDELYLPHYEVPSQAGERAKYPFILNTYRLMAVSGGQWANMPWLQESLAVHLHEYWDSWVEVNPFDAEKLHLTDGGQVWVESVKGKIKLRARIFAGCKLGTVAIPIGQGHTSYGRWANGRGVNTNDIIAKMDDTIKGYAQFNGTRVRLIKA